MRRLSVSGWNRYHLRVELEEKDPADLGRTLDDTAHTTRPVFPPGLGADCLEHLACLGVEGLDMVIGQGNDNGCG